MQDNNQIKIAFPLFPSQSLVDSKLKSICEQSNAELNKTNDVQTKRNIVKRMSEQIEQVETEFNAERKQEESSFEMKRRNAMSVSDYYIDTNDNLHEGKLYKKLKISHAKFLDGTRQKEFERDVLHIKLIKQSLQEFSNTLNEEKKVLQNPHQKNDACCPNCGVGTKVNVLGDDKYNLTEISYEEAQKYPDQKFTCTTCGILRKTDPIWQKTIMQKSNLNQIEDSHTNISYNQKNAFHKSMNNHTANIYHAHKDKAKYNNNVSLSNRKGAGGSESYNYQTEKIDIIQQLYPQESISETNLSTDYVNLDRGIITNKIYLLLYAIKGELNKAEPKKAIQQSQYYQTILNIRKIILKERGVNATDKQIRDDIIQQQRPHCNNYQSSEFFNKNAIDQLTNSDNDHYQSAAEKMKQVESFVQAGAFFQKYDKKLETSTSGCFGKLFRSSHFRTKQTIKDKVTNAGDKATFTEVVSSAKDGFGTCSFWDSRTVQTIKELGWINKKQGTYLNSIENYEANEEAPTEFRRAWEDASAINIKR